MTDLVRVAPDQSTAPDSTPTFFRTTRTGKAVVSQMVGNGPNASSVWLTKSEAKALAFLLLDFAKDD